MSELGLGSGSSYPGALDVNASTEVDAPNPGKTKARAAIVNDLAAAILAVETELGVDPAGSKANLVTYLAVEHNSDGVHKDTLVCVLSGIQTYTAQKTYQKEIIGQSGAQFGLWGITGSGTQHVQNRAVISQSGAMWIWGDVRASGAMGMITYTDGNRPPAAQFGAGMMIFNSSDNFPNISDGTNWRDMTGNVT